MCHKIKILAKGKSGVLSLCDQCAIFHLEFNNVYFEFTQEQFKHFREYVLNIDADYWEDRYSCNAIRRKIPIPSMQENLVLMFNKQEIKQLTALLFYGESQHMSLLEIADIDYNLILN